jgi:glucokinase
VTRTVLAVDLGGTKTAIARVDDAGQVHERRTLPAGRSLDESVDQIVLAARDVAAVGVVVPGIYVAETGAAWCPNLWGSREVPLRTALEERLGPRVVIDSDRSAYVLGEAWLGAARGLRHVVFVAIGTGIGVGILSDGKVLRGAGAAAGAAGWFALDPAWKSDYGSIGCWEAEAAGPALASSCGMPDAHAVVAAARAGHQGAIDALQRAARYSGMGIANLISALDPEAVILGGGVLTGAGDLLVGPIRAEVRRWAQPIAASHCRIELTQLGEAAGFLGAARLALDGI